MSREDQIFNLKNRKRCILYLIEKYLKDVGLKNSAMTLQNEAFLQNNYEICDNIDLDTIYLEYCSYFYLKFGKHPKILKNSNDNNNKLSSAFSRKNSNADIQKSATKNSENQKKLGNELQGSLKFSGFLAVNKDNLDVSDLSEKTLIDAEYSLNSEWKDLASIILRDLVKTNYNIKWNDISGNKDIINILKEAVILPLEHPEYFNDFVKPWKTILLYGPPGTGKTMLAKTLCSETFGKVAFFYIRSSTIISKWRGESEKIVRVLFDIAHYCAPSIIFFDEIDGITSHRDTSIEHEASKRFKNELLSLLDNIEAGSKGVFILGNTNIPWNIDPAFLRRFERKLLVQLPSIDERKQLLRNLLRTPNTKAWTEKILNNVAVKCEGFTGDEIRVACKEVSMKQLRLNYQKDSEEILNFKLSESDILEAFNHVQPLGYNLMSKHIEWSKQCNGKLA